MMRLALITRYDPFRTLHGTEIFGRNLAFALAALGHEVHAIFGSAPPHLRGARIPQQHPKLHSHLITRRTSRVLREGEYLVRTRFLLRNLLQAISPDAIIGVGAGQGQIFGSIDRSAGRCVLVYYAMDCMAQEGREVTSFLRKEGASFRDRIYNKARYSWLVRLDRRSCQHADLIVSTSQDTKKNLNKYYGVSMDKIAVNYLGIPDNYAQGIPISKPKIPTFLHIATRHERKGTRYLLDALRILHENGKEPVRAIIRGSADPRYIELSRGLDVCFVTPGDVRPLYSSCTALVVPSVAEGFCLPVVEAAAFGKPSIVSSAGSLPEIVHDGESGYVVATGNSEMLAERMLEFCERPSLVEMMGRMAKDISRRFTIENSAQNLLRIIEGFS